MNCKMGLAEPNKTIVRTERNTAYEDPLKGGEV